MSDPITSEIAHVARRRAIRYIDRAEIACITRMAMIALARAALRQRDIEVAGYWLERAERAALHHGG